jgi:hypothetical protein
VDQMKEMIGKDLVIVAGPSASGKSHLIRQLTTKRKNKFRDKVYRQLDINPQEPRSHISIGALTKLDSKPGHSRKLIKELIFIHFDITSRHQSDKQHLLKSIANSCKSIKVVTLKTPFDVWHQRMRQRIDVNPTKNPSNIADEIYRLSRFSRYFAKWRYESIYKKWEKLIKNIDLNGQLIVKNEEMPFKPRKKKTID